MTNRWVVTLTLAGAAPFALAVWLNVQQVTLLGADAAAWLWGYSVVIAAFLAGAGVTAWLVADGALLPTAPFFTTDLAGGFRDAGAYCGNRGQHVPGMGDAGVCEDPLRVVAGEGC